MATQDGKLAVLRKRAAELKARITQAEAQEKAKARKEETREKVLIGAAFLADIKQHPETRAGVVEVLKRGIVAPKDREFLKARGWF
jgi:hypothetical protein